MTTASSTTVARQATGQRDLFNQIMQVVTEEDHAAVIQLRHDRDRWYWKLADTANRWYESVIANRIPATQQDVCAALAWELDDENIGAASIYLYARLGAFFSDPAARAKFEVLPVSHLRYAATFGKSYKHVLNYDLDQMARRGGRPISLFRLKEHFEPDKYRINEAAAMGDDVRGYPAASAGDPATAEGAARPGDPIQAIEQDVARLRNNLQVVQQSSPRLAQFIGQIILLCNTALEEIGRAPARPSTPGPSPDPAV